MKYAGLAMSLLVTIILTVTIIFAVGHKTNRNNEAENALGVAVENTLENIMRDRTYDIADKDEFVADFLEDLVLQIDSYSDIEITCKAIDINKGVFSVEVNLSFLYNNGNQGQVSAERTVIFETLSSKPSSSTNVNTKLYVLEYYVANETGEYELYKTISLAQGTKIPNLTPPNQETATFANWTFLQGGKINTLKNQTVTANIKLYAQYK